ERHLHDAAAAITPEGRPAGCFVGEKVLYVGPAALPAQIEQEAPPLARGAGRQVERRASEGTEPRVQLDLELQALRSQEHAANGMQAVAGRHGLTRKKDLRPVGERQELAFVDCELGGVTADGATLAVLLLLARVDGHLIPAQHETGHRLVGKSKKDGVGGGNTQLRQGGKRLLSPPPPEAGAVVGADTPSSFDQTLRPWVVLAVRGERDHRPPATRQGALQKAARRQRLVIGMRRQEEHALARSRTVPGHSTSPVSPKGENPRSAACAQITAR